VGGYLTRINVDVGDSVKAGQVIAEIQSPELDAQAATISTALENKRQIARRTSELASQGFFSQQTLDNVNTDVRVAEAQINEIRTLSGYRTIRAPFAGVVTGRFADPGALVTNAATNQTAALPLVTIADTSRLKVTVYVEQADARSVKAGLEAEVVDAAATERKLSAKIARVSGELDGRTRTLRTEVEFDNANQVFMAGSFVNVALLIPAVSYIEVPSGALISRDKKTFVATIDAEQKAHLVPIVVASTDGKVLRIASGLDEGVTVAVSPPAGLQDGAKVNPQAPPGAPPAAKPAAAPAPPAAAPAKP
jgi:RND family efflux transporter MFP subunit